MIEFLLDYYIWILAVLGIIIVTIIGFLVDSKQKRKKKEMGRVTPQNEVQTVEPLPEANAQETAPIVDAKTEQVPTVVDNVIEGKVNNMTSQLQQSIQQNPIEQPVQQTQTAPVNFQTETNINQGTALSEQKPHFEPREVVMPAQSQMPINNDNTMAVPKPINTVSINQPISQQPQQQYNSFVQPQVPPVDQNVNGQMINAVPVNNMQPMMQQPQAFSTRQMVAPNPTGYNTTINNNQAVNNQNMPRPMPGMELTQPVSQITNVPVNQPAAMPIQNSQSIVQQPTATAPNPNFGISFVTGEPNAINDDTWKL